MTGLEQLFAQHPLPWAFDDCREGFEGLVTVFDANGRSIVCTGDMEDCTMADILLAHAIAALPELLIGVRAALREQRLTNRTSAQLRAVLEGASDAK